MKGTLFKVYIVLFTISGIFHSIKFGQASDGSIAGSSDYALLPAFYLYYDPPFNHSSPTALGVFVWSNIDDAKIYYEALGDYPTLNSSHASKTQPYIELDTPLKGSRNRTLILIGVWTDGDGKMFKSNQISVNYFVEASARPYSYGYLVPGIESSGYFLQFALEVKATARAQAAGNQEFSDFFTDLGLGTYSSQIQALNLLAIDPDLQGFEGGFPCELRHCKLHNQARNIILLCCYDYSQYKCRRLLRTVDPLSQRRCKPPLSTSFRISLKLFIYLGFLWQSSCRQSTQYVRCCSLCYQLCLRDPRCPRTRARQRHRRYR